MSEEEMVHWLAVFGEVDEKGKPPRHSEKG